MVDRIDLREASQLAGIDHTQSGNVPLRSDVAHHIRLGSFQSDQQPDPEQHPVPRDWYQISPAPLLLTGTLPDLEVDYFHYHPVGVVSLRTSDVTVGSHVSPRYEKSSIDLHQEPDRP